MRILTWASKHFGNDVSEDILRSGVDLLLEILHTDLDGKKNRCEEILDGYILEDDFYELSKLSEQLTDYSKETEEHEINNNGGIAIELDDNHDNFDESYINELKNATDERSGEYDVLNDNDTTQSKESSSYFIGSSAETQIINPERDPTNNGLSVPEFQEIDQFWLTNQVAKLYPSVQSHEHMAMTQSLIGLMKRFMQENISSKILFLNYSSFWGKINRSLFRKSFSMLHTYITVCS